MLEWIRFGIAAVLAVGGAACAVVAVIGVNRFKFVMNRMHAAGMLDSLGILLIMASLIVAFGFSGLSLKLGIAVAFVWITSPVSTHMLSQLEVLSDESAPAHMKVEPDGEEKENGID